MYRGVWRSVDAPRIADAAVALPLVWNPPGWGSYQGPELQAWSEAVPGRWRLAMVVGIRPGGFIPFHRDDPAAENALTGASLERFHLVLATNRECWNFHDGTWQQLEIGGIYTMDPAREHASINLGETMRLHLVVDIDRNSSVFGPQE